MTDFKYFADLRELKHEKIIDFFLEHEIGSSNPIMTYLSVLAPIDRCVILEQLFNPNILNSWDLRDKMVLAYVKIGRIDLANKIIEYSVLNGDIDLNVSILKSKLDLGIPPKMDNSQRLEIMYREIKKETGALETEFLQLLVRFISIDDNSTKTTQPESSIVGFIENMIAKNVVSKIESKFNTKVLRFGIAEKGTKEFEQLTPFYTVAPNDADLLFWFLIPLDEADNIVTNDYYPYHELEINESRYAEEYSRKSLKQDWDLSNYLEQLLECQIYDTGGMKIESYRETDNIIPNAEKIEKLTYRFFRFYSPKGL